MAAQLSQTLLLTVPLAPLAGAIIAGLLGHRIGRRGTHWVAIIGLTISFIASMMVLAAVEDGARFNQTIYEWMVLGDPSAAGGTLKMEIGFLIDGLTALMMCVVTFVSLMVHIYTIGYMADDPGYTRFFSYISLFTFSMLMLVMSNNFLQLFFGWEAVGLVSYLLIGFWYTRPTAIYAGLKAFMVNRIGDFGFILGIGLILAFTGSLDYADVFAQGPALAKLAFPGSDWMLITVICICLFIGAMGKSAQFPLHVWLPDSMEGPTPISALIHAATMVTAGIFMVARMSPLFELSDAALSFVMLIGAITALFMGILGIVQNDIKRVIAYSTLSQLGYMTVALGASAYSVGVFHLMTHAFFKALLFLAAGSVIIAMHHDQDMRNMGGLRKYMPITWLTTWVGSLALVSMPLFSGFYSKDSIIEAVHASQLPGAGFAYFAVLAGVFVTALYTFRMLFMVFHGTERFRHKRVPPEGDAPGVDDATAASASHAPAHSAHSHDAQESHDVHGAYEPHESPWVITVPLILLAIPSAVIGYLTIEPLLFGNFFNDSITVNTRSHPAMVELAHEFHGAAAMTLHGLAAWPFWFMLAGLAVAWLCYLVYPAIPARLATRFAFIYRLLEQKYYLDWIGSHVFARGARVLGLGLWKGGDVGVIDGGVVGGSVRGIGGIAVLTRRLQSGYLYWYALVMILGVIGLMTWQLWPYLLPLRVG